MFPGTCIGAAWIRTPPPHRSVNLSRQRFLDRLSSLSIRPTARDYYVRWAEDWTKARDQQSAERTQAYFDALGRSTHLADWKFRQSADATRILACDVLALPWASSFDWRGLADQARSLEPDHRTVGRENIRVSAGGPNPLDLP